MKIFRHIVLALALLASSLSAAPAANRSVLFAASCPPSVLVGAVCPDTALNFNTGVYWTKANGYVPLNGLVSVSRASTGYAADTNGVLYSFAANVPRITNQGFLIEEARTNKSTNYNANPTATTNFTTSLASGATFTVVDDTAALLAAGLQNIATSGKVYKLDNSAGATNSEVLAVGTTGNTNPHGLSVYLHGSGNFFWGLPSSYGTAVSAPALFSRLSKVTTPVDAVQQFGIKAQAGAIVYFILNQPEEGASVTSPIVIAGASATRAADVPQLIGPALAAALSAKAAFFQTTGGEGISTAARLLDFNGTQSMSFASTSTVAITNGTNTATDTLGSGAYSGLVKSAFGFDATSITAKSNNGTQATSANAWGTPSGAVYIGNLAAGNRAANEYIQRFALSQTKGLFDGATAP